MYNIIYAILRTAVALILLLAVTRLMGRKSISQMTFFDFAVAITLGSVTGNVGLGSNITFGSSIAVLLTLGVLGFIIGFSHIKSFSIRKLVNSEPVVVISNGQIVKKNMSKIRLTINELTSLLREKNIFNIADVNFAILENDGKLSVLPKANKKPLTPFDMNLSVMETGLTRELVIDGKIMQGNLKGANKTEKWLFDELKNKGAENIKEVFFAALDTAGNLYVSKGDKQVEQKGEYGIE